TQRGNNNAYCQDNELSWIDWDLTEEQKALVEFTKKLIHFRLSQPVLRRRKYFQGRSIRGVKDVAWLAPDGREMADGAWNPGVVRSIGMLLAGNAIEELDEQGRPIAGDTLLVLLNAHHGKVPFTLPQLDTQHQWLRIIDTISIRSTERPYKGGVRYPLQGRSLALFRMTPPLRERRRSAIEIARRATEPAVPQPA